MRSRPEFSISLGHLVELRLRDPANLSHQLRRIPPVVLAQQLEDAALVLQRLIAVDRPLSKPAPVCSSNAWVACSRIPAADATSPPSYIQLERS